MPQTALITGASVGIGYELAKQFARGGYNVLLHGRDEARLQAVAEEVKRMGVQADYIARDLAQVDGPIAVYADTMERGIEVDVLVNNAGFGALGRFDEIELQRQVDMVQVNVSALVELTHRFLPGMKSRGQGGVLNVASTAAYQAGPLMAVYYASKAFVLSFTEAIAEELKGTGLKVSALCPGPTESEFRKRAKMDDAAEQSGGAIRKMSAEAVAYAGYKGWRRGKRVVVPGLINKLGVQSTRLGTRRMATRIAGKINKAK
jgi:short-subunit dehydrogenase